MIVGAIAKAPSTSFSETNPALRSAFRGYNSGALFLVTPTTVDRFTETASVEVINLPHACSFVERLASGGNFANRQYLVGGHTCPIIIDEDFRASRQSIRPPSVKPSVSTSAGTFSQICYWRWYDEITDERSPLSEGLELENSEMDRTWTNIPIAVDSEAIQIEGTANFGPPGAPVDTVAFTLNSSSDLRPGDRIAVVGSLDQWGKVLEITNLANVIIDDLTMMGPQSQSIVVKPVSRISHVELWVSVDGGLPRFVKRVRIGTTTVTETTEVLAMGESEIEPFTAMPHGTISLMYNRRQLVAGVEGFEDTVFLSEIDFPERYVGLSYATHYNEPIVGLFRYRDYVVVLCSDSSYKLQGFTVDDYSLTVLDARIGGMGHHGNAVTEVQAFVPGKKGLQLFNGAFHQGISNRRTEWMQKYQAHRSAFERGVGFVNDNDETYQFLPYVMRYDPPDNFEEVGPDNRRLGFSRFNVAPENPVVWVGTYSSVGPQSDGSLSQPEWTDDTPSTPSIGAQHGLTTYAKYITRTGERTGKLYRGDCFGRIFFENLLDDEQAPAFHTNSRIVTSHSFFGSPGGDEEKEGHKYIRGWSYLRSEWSDWVLSVFPGDDYACPDRPTSRFQDKSTDVAGVLDNSFVAPDPPESPYQYEGSASRAVKDAVDVADQDARYAPLTIHPHSSLDCEGRGFTHEYIFTNPKHVRFMGFGAVVGPGTTSRREWSSKPLPEV